MRQETGGAFYFQKALPYEKPIQSDSPNRPNLNSRSDPKSPLASRHYANPRKRFRNSPKTNSSELERCPVRAEVRIPPGKESKIRGQHGEYQM